MNKSLLFLPVRGRGQSEQRPGKRTYRYIIRGLLSLSLPLRSPLPLPLLLLLLLFLLLSSSAVLYVSPPQ